MRINKAEIIISVAAATAVMLLASCSVAVTSPAESGYSYHAAPETTVTTTPAPETTVATTSAPETTVTTTTAPTTTVTTTTAPQTTVTTTTAPETTVITTTAPETTTTATTPAPETTAATTPAPVTTPATTPAPATTAATTPAPETTAAVIPDQTPKPQTTRPEDGYIPSHDPSKPLSAKPFTYTPPAKTKYSDGGYSPIKALSCAEKNWDTNIGLCAEFVSRCLRAGGLTKYGSTSSTDLYNQLVGSGLGYAVGIKREKDGTVKLPEYALQGDVIFYYCKAENVMVHTVLYNGNSSDGYMKAYAHNYPADGSTVMKYFDKCDCKANLDTVVLFCFYRDKTPAAVSKAPALAVKQNGGSAEFITSKPAFIYTDSVLSVVDQYGHVTYSRSIGTDLIKTLNFYDKGKYTIEIEYFLGETSLCKTNELQLIINKPYIKPQTE